MNKILVLVDLNTLKRNPEAGKTERRICIGKSATLETNCRISDPRFEGWLQSSAIENGLRAAVYTYSIPAELVEEAQQLGRLTIENHYETSRTLRPALSHLFSYVQAVECPLCGATHHPSDFWWPDDNEEADEHTEAQCPSCRAEIEIEFESIKSALARIAEIIGGGDA
jgi:hypothetical protein